MTKSCNRYYAAVVPDPDKKGIFYASFGVPGQAPRWVTRKDGERQSFFTHDEAEIAGWRHLAGYLNRASGAQVYEVKPRAPKAFRNFEPIHPIHGRMTDVERVFSKGKPT